MTTASRTFAVKNFDRFQHYKDRSPPWIKLYNELFDDYEFSALPDALKGQLILIWLLASRMDNRIPYDAAWVSKRISSTEPVDLDELLARGFIVEHDAETARGKREEWPSRYISDAVKQEVMERDEGKCRQCGTTENLEFDHIIPVSKGGASRPENLQLLCRRHNRQKRATHSAPPAPEPCSIPAEQVATQTRSPETEERKRESPEPKGSGADGAVFDPEAVIFDQGRRYLESCGVPPPQARSLLGKWRKALGDGPLIDALGDAKRDNVQAPVEWMEGVIRQRAKRPAKSAGYVPMGVGG